MKQNYTVAEIYTLPSKGEIYDSQVVPEFKVRSMTTTDEMKRLSPSDYAYKLMSDVIDDCMVESPGISSYDMCIGDYLFCLHKLRVVTYGSEYKTASTCPLCMCTNKDSIDLDSLPVVCDIEKFKELQEFDLPVSKVHVKLHVQTPRMLDKIAEQVKEYKKRSGDKNVDLSLVYTLVQIIDKIDGKTPDKFELEQWVKDLPMKDSNILVSHMEKMNSCIGVQIDLENECDVCGYTYKSKLNMNSEFFRPTFDC